MAFGIKKDPPVCIRCGLGLHRNIQQTGIHSPRCAWNYFIECHSCKYKNSLSKLLGFWEGCSQDCEMLFGEKHGESKNKV